MLFAPPTAAVARELLIMASCPFELSMSEVAAAMLPPANPREVDDAVRPFRYLFQRIDGRYYFSHDSLRVFADRNLRASRLSVGRQIALLCSFENDSRTGDYLLHLLAEATGDTAGSAKIDCDWLSRQIAAGANPWRLDEGLMHLTLAALARGDWRQLARWWSQRACLQRAEFEGELIESTLVNAWLAMGQLSLVERYVFISVQFLSKTYPGPDLLDLLENDGQEDLAERLRDRQMSQSPPPIGPEPIIDEFANYVRHAALRMPAAELLPVIQERVRQLNEFKAINGVPMRTPAQMLADYVDSIVRECLNADDLDRAEEWLTIDDSLLDEPIWAEHYISIRILRGDLTENADDVCAAIGAVETLRLLEQLSIAGGFDEQVRRAIQEFNLNPLLQHQVYWYDTQRVAAATADLIHDVSICTRLGVQERLDAIHGRRRIYEDSGCPNIYRSHYWVNGNRGCPGRLNGNRRSRSSSSRYPESAAESFTPTTFMPRKNSSADLAKSSSELHDSARSLGAEDAFAKMVETELFPALAEARIDYENGHLSISDMFLADGMCPGTTLRMLRTVEERFYESTTFKCTSLIYLAVRYARAGDPQSAERTMAAGVRSAFTYGYSKDTTINSFLVAFELVAAHLGTRFASIAEFTARTFIVLDALTDGRMLNYGSSYFISVVGRHDMKLAARLAQSLWTKCRSLRPHWIHQAASDLKVDLTKLKRVFAKYAPDVILVSADQREKEGRGRNLPPDFVTGDTIVPTSKRERVAELESAIERSAYGSRIPQFSGLVKSLDRFR